MLILMVNIGKHTVHGSYGTELGLEYESLLIDFEIGLLNGNLDNGSHEKELLPKNPDPSRSNRIDGPNPIPTIGL